MARSKPPAAKVIKRKEVVPESDESEESGSDKSSSPENSDVQKEQEGSSLEPLVISDDSADDSWEGFPYCST